MSAETGSFQEQLTALLGRLWPEGTPGEARMLTGGASQETWAFEVGTPNGPHPLILRRSASAPESATDSIALADEARLIDRLARHGLAVPAVEYVLRPEDGLGEGFVMTQFAGETLPQRILKVPELAGARERLAWDCGMFLGTLHQVPTGELGFLRKTDTAEEIERQYQQYRRTGVRRPVFELAFRWLRDHCPPDGGAAALVHGDFRNGNLIVADSGLRAVIDWELAHLGNPMEDLGWICVSSWRFGELDHPVGGFGSREALLAGYEAAGGGRVDPEVVAYWEIFGTLRWGVICQVMAESYVSGAHRTVERAVIGRRSSEAEVDLLHLLAPLERGALPTT